MTLQFKYNKTLQLKPSLGWQSAYSFLIKKAQVIITTPGCSWLITQTPIPIGFTYSVDFINDSVWNYCKISMKFLSILVFYVQNWKITTLQCGLNKTIKSKPSLGWQSQLSLSHKKRTSLFYQTKILINDYSKSYFMGFT